MNPAFLVVLLLVSGALFTVSEARAWESSLYPGDWTPPEARQAPPSFETDKLIQDFSYAGYRRSEVAIPTVAGPIFDVVEGYGADPTGGLDSTAPIQSAIDAAAEAGGGVVFLPAGTYRVRPQGNAAASLRIRRSGVVLRGAGPGSTFIFNDAWQMRNKDIIRVDSPGSGWATVPEGSPETSIRSDLPGPAVQIPVAGVAGFAAGDWIVLRADASEAFKEEHNMGNVWGGQGVGPGVLFVRQIVAIDEASNTLTIDVPTRYYLKTRDSARVHLLGPHIDEVGLEDFSIGNIEHPNHGSTSGWSTGDYSVAGTHAHDVHGSYAISMTRTRNSWIRGVQTYRPPQNSLNAHVLSNALRIGNSVALTVENCHFQRALYSGGGGNAYMVRITNGQEILVKDTVVGYNRHGFVFSHMQTSGNVILRGRAEHTGWRAIAGGAGSSGSDHHMWMSQ
ncbi:MAG: glycosyl hydrolase family 28-related protein, partial [Bradymonadaceae bacterium]